MFTRLAAAAALALALCAPAQPDVSGLPETIKTLDWKGVDVGALSGPERCRALNFMNEVLDELGAAGRAEADLLSTFIDERGLGPQFVERPPADAPLTYDDAVKISVAMLRGPLADSEYAKEFTEETDANTLGAFERLFESTCKRKWTEVVEAKVQVRSMTRFLDEQKLSDAYKAWVPAEVERREKEYEAAMAQRRAEAQASAEARAEAAKQAAEERRARKEQEDAARQLQRELARAQQREAAQQAQAQGEVVYDDDDDDYVWGYGAGTYLGASGWYARPEYRGRAGADVENRMNKWRGGGGGGGRRGGRR